MKRPPRHLKRLIRVVRDWEQFSVSLAHADMPDFKRLQTERMYSARYARYLREAAQLFLAEYLLQRAFFIRPISFLIGILVGLAAYDIGSHW